MGFEDRMLNRLVRVNCTNFDVGERIFTVIPNSYWDYKMIDLKFNDNAVPCSWTIINGVIRYSPSGCSMHIIRSSYNHAIVHLLKSAQLFKIATKSNPIIYHFTFVDHLNNKKTLLFLSQQRSSKGKGVFSSKSMFSVNNVLLNFLKI